jgi:ketosteroid isomerase-like protein
VTEADVRVAAVRNLWQAYMGGGVDAMLAAVGEDVDWQPYAARGAVFHGSAELRDYYAGLAERGERHEPTVYELESHGDAVLLTGALRVVRSGRLTESQLAWVYTFDGERLVSASGYASRAEALRSIAVRA